MSFLDLDELLIDLAEKVEILYSPLVDRKSFPEHVDVTLVEGAVGSEADRNKILTIRARSTFLISFGDCAVTANVPGMRNRFAVAEVLRRSYIENAKPALPGSGGALPESGEIFLQTVPRLCPQARPVHEFVLVDVFLPGCPPPPEAISYLLSELLAGRLPDMSGRSRFGA
jgi:NAD-reducing hydrogenase small subunit